MKWHVPHVFWIPCQIYTSKRSWGTDILQIRGMISPISPTQYPPLAIIYPLIIFLLNFSPSNTRISTASHVLLWSMYTVHFLPIILLFILKIWLICWIHWYNQTNQFGSTFRCNHFAIFHWLHFLFLCLLPHILWF